MPETLLSHAESLWQTLARSLPGLTVEVLRRIDSTNSELMRRARAGVIEPVLLVAEEQSAGRGRLGKTWHSQAGQSLTFSLALPLAPTDWSGLSLAVGVSLAHSLHPEVRLKWPNDLWLQQRKLGGILVETAACAAPGSRQRVAVIGVGLNLARPAAAALAALTCAPAALPAQAPAGLSELLVGISAGELLERVAPALVRDLLAFESQGFAAFALRFAQRDALRGLPLQLSDGTQGTACGVNEQGALQLLTAHGMRSVNHSNLSVRPC